MTLTDGLLAVLIVLVAGLGLLGWRQHKETVEWLDALGNMLGDALESWRKEREERKDHER